MIPAAKHSKLLIVNRTTSGLRKMISFLKSPLCDEGDRSLKATSSQMSLSELQKFLRQRFRQRLDLIRDKWTSWEEAEEQRRKADREEYSRRWKLYQTADSLGLPLFEALYWRVKDWPVVVPSVPEWDPVLDGNGTRKDSQTRGLEKEAKDEEGVGGIHGSGSGNKGSDSIERVVVKQKSASSAHRKGGKWKHGKDKQSEVILGKPVATKEVKAGDEWQSIELIRPGIERLEERDVKSDMDLAGDEQTKEKEEDQDASGRRQRKWFWNRKDTPSKKNRNKAATSLSNVPSTSKQ